MRNGHVDEALARAAERQRICDLVKDVIVNRLELPIPPEWITDDQPLFGRGLELDSLDALELSMGIDAEFGIPIYEDNVATFGSVSMFVDYMISQGFDPKAHDKARDTAHGTADTAGGGAGQ